jgi:hypothetical protein
MYESISLEDSSYYISGVCIGIYWTVNALNFSLGFYYYTSDVVFTISQELLFSSIGESVYVGWILTYSNVVFTC